MADEIHDLNVDGGDYNQDKSELEVLMSDGIHDLNVAEGDYNQDKSGLEALMSDKIHDLNVVEGDYNQDKSELEALTARINELVTNMLKQETYLKDKLATKKEYLASFTVSLENSNKEIQELQRQIAEMRETNEKYQSLIGALSSLAAEQEMQLKDLKNVIGTKEEVIMSFAISFENSKTEQKSNEENSELKAEQKALKKMLKQLQKEERKSSKENA
jgi:chromosome segregation ATPase